MLNRDPDNRISAYEALKHPWFRLNNVVRDSLDIEFEDYHDLSIQEEEEPMSIS